MFDKALFNGVKLKGNKRQILNRMKNKFHIKKPNAYHKYKVIKDIEGVSIGEIAPAFNQIGGGTQYNLPEPIIDLIYNGYLEEIL